MTDQDATPETLRELAKRMAWQHGEVTGNVLAHHNELCEAAVAAADAWEDDLHSLKLAREDKVTQWVEISSLHKRLEAAREGWDLCLAELKRKDKRLEAAEKALEDIERWSHAYPLEVFPEPDFKKVRQLLEAGGITLDAVSASNMRHVVTEVGKMARAALAGEEKP